MIKLKAFLQYLSWSFFFSHSSEHPKEINQEKKAIAAKEVLEALLLNLFWFRLMLLFYRIWGEIGKGLIL